MSTEQNKVGVALSSYSGSEAKTKAALMLEVSRQEGNQPRKVLLQQFVKK